MTWYDNNEVKAYPLLGDDDASIPSSIFVDILIHAPDDIGQDIEISSVSVTSLIASVVFTVNGTPVAYATVDNSSSLPHNPVELTPIVEGVTGHVTFGYGVLTERLRVDGNYPLHDDTLISYPASVTTPTLRAKGHDFFGRVKVEAGTNVTIDVETLDIQLEDLSIESRTCAVFRLSEPVRIEPVSVLHRSAEADLPTPPIRTINGILPPLELQVVVIKEFPEEENLSVSGTPGDVKNIFFDDDGEPCEVYP